jgi:glyoxylate reductase
MMSAARRITEAEMFLRGGKWNRWAIDLLVGQDLHHATLGILGMGRIGQAMARRGRGFDMRVLYHDDYRIARDLERDVNAEYVSMDRVLRESDFVSLHVPLVQSTRHLIGEEQLRKMKPTAVLVNTARGPVVDEAALARALSEKWIFAAGLDVFEHEPEVHPALLACTNVVLAPHIASASVATRRRMSTMAAENAVAALEGRRPPNLVNPDVWK